MFFFNEKYDITANEVEDSEKSVATVLTINMKEAKTPVEFQLRIKQELGMPEFYGMNWDSYWDAITGLITLPDKLILSDWNVYKCIQEDDAYSFEKIMKEYNELEDYEHCQCIYNE